MMLPETFILSLDVRDAFREMQLQNDKNIKVADIACQLLLLSTEMDTRLDLVINDFIFSIKHGNISNKPVGRIYYQETVDLIIEDLTEKYPMLFNNLFNYERYQKTGIVQLNDKRDFVSQFYETGEVSDHYDYLVSDSLVNLLLTKYNDLLAGILDFFPMDNFKNEIITSLDIFFRVIGLKIMDFLYKNRLTNVIATRQSRLSKTEDTLLIELETVNQLKNLL